MSDSKKKSSEYDIFIAKSIYPEVESIFTTPYKGVKEVKENCYIVLDTNVLLLPYEIGKESLEEIKKTYTYLVEQKRLIIPGQVAREFVKNRATKLTNLYGFISNKKDFSKLKQGAQNLRKGRYPLLEQLEAYQESLRLEKEINDLLEEMLGKYKDALDNVLKHISSWVWDDPVSSLYASLFTKEVILEPTIDDEKMKDDLSNRQVHSIPPGYKDASKADGGIGDVLIWHTILHAGEQYKENVIFVSGERKADWWHKSGDTPLYPRYELVDEFRRSSDGKSFHIIELSELLELYGASDSVVNEVRQEEEQAYSEQQDSSFNCSFSDIQDSVFRWLKAENFEKRVTKSEIDSFDFIVVDTSGLRTGVEIKVTHDPSRFGFLKNKILSLDYSQLSISKFMVIFVISDVTKIASFKSNLVDSLDLSSKAVVSKSVSLIFGHLDTNNDFLLQEQIDIP